MHAVTCRADELARVKLDSAAVTQYLGSNRGREREEYAIRYTVSFWGQLALTGLRPAAVWDSGRGHCQSDPRSRVRSAIEVCSTDHRVASDVDAITAPQIAVAPPLDLNESAIAG